MRVENEELRKTVDRMRSTSNRAVNPNSAPADVSSNACLLGPTCVWFKNGTCPKIEWHKAQGHGGGSPEAHSGVSANVASTHTGSDHTTQVL